MSEKKSFKQKLDKFFAGKGFYIVLVLCIAVIGVSTYYLLSDRLADVDEYTNEVLESQDNKNDSNMSVVPPDIDESTLEQYPEEPASLDDDAKVEDTDVWNEQTAEDAAAAQMIWPLDGEIDLPYSVAALIFHEKLGDWRIHDGVDIAATLGTQVLAISAGVVESVEMDDMGGMTVVIEHAGGLRSIYSNLAAVPTVYVGDNVSTGEVIGSVGTTAPGETAENPHLCLKMTLDGQSVDPSTYLPQR